MSNFEQMYSTVMSNCMKTGIKVNGRNGRVRQITAAQIRANLNDGFPVVTGKQIFPRSCFVEIGLITILKINLKTIKTN